jgi:nitroreductase
LDTFRAIASKRDERAYAGTPIPDEVVTRILDAGRLAGSARNRQPWRFVLLSDREAVARAVYEPDNVRGAALVVAVAEATGIDAGRCVQNMMLAAWNDGVVSCPNGIADPTAAEAAAGAPVALILTFGYPARPRDPESRSAAEWSAGANRKPLDEIVTRR